MTRLENKITLFNIPFNFNPCKTLSKNEPDALSDTASNFFLFIQGFGNKVKLRNFVNISMVEDRVQNLDSVSFGMFQLYFYDNLFNPNENSKIQDNRNFTERTFCSWQSRQKRRNNKTMPHWQWYYIDLKYITVTFLQK